MDGGKEIDLNTKKKRKKKEKRRGLNENSSKLESLIL